MRSCEVCGADYRPRRRSQRVCSWKCRGRLGVLERAAPALRSRTCALCAAPIQAKGYRPVYCEACRHPERKCTTCGTVFTAPDRRSRFCSKSCRSKAAAPPTGREHWNWKGGATYYRGPGWRHIRDAARERDEWRCQDCGEDRRGRKLDVHHIVPAEEWDRPGTANDLDNLVSLCPACHRRREVKAAA